MLKADKRWRSIGASVAGSSHQAHGRDCEDAHAYRLLAGDMLVAAVADGAGSAVQAKVGAVSAVQVALEVVQGWLVGEISGQTTDWSALFNTILGRVREILQSQAAGEDLAMRDFATTLLVAIITPTEVIAMQLGDGAIVTHDLHGDFQTLTKPYHGEFLNETAFVTSDDYLMRTQVAVQASDAVDGLALLTDGLQMLALNMNDNRAHAPFFGPLLRFASNPAASEDELNFRLAAFLDTERLNNATDDDKTLVLAVRL